MKYFQVFLPILLFLFSSCLREPIELEFSKFTYEQSIAVNGPETASLILTEIPGNMVRARLEIDNPQSGANYVSIAEWNVDGRLFRYPLNNISTPENFSITEIYGDSTSTTASRYTSARIGFADFIKWKGRVRIYNNSVDSANLRCVIPAH